MSGSERDTSAHVRRNREHWETRSADYQGWNREQLNTNWDELRWGVWDISEDELHVLGDVDGVVALEFGCGACQTGIKVAMRGARVTGLDFSGPQLREGLRNMEAIGVRFPVVQADGERIPFADGSFDLVWCDHGVMSFADPYRTVPEVARVLRAGGLLAFSMVSAFAWITALPEDERVSRELKQPYFGLRSQDLDDPDWHTTEFQLTYGDWIRLFRANGFVIEDLLELRPEPDSVSTYIDPQDLPWSRDYPMDHIWKVRKG